MSIHVIEAKHNFVKLSNDEYESGWWELQESKAQELVGGDIYFHKTRGEPSYYGGRILDYRVADGEAHQGMIIFKLKYSKDCRNVRTDKVGWVKALKITKVSNVGAGVKNNG